MKASDSKSPEQSPYLPLFSGRPVYTFDWIDYHPYPCYASYPYEWHDFYWSEPDLSSLNDIDDPAPFFLPKLNPYAINLESKINAGTGPYFKYKSGGYVYIPVGGISSSSSVLYGFPPASDDKAYIEAAGALLDLLKHSPKFTKENLADLMGHETSATWKGKFKLRLEAIKKLLG